MSRKKKLFFLLSALFVALLLYASYDISRRTTFPGSKGQLKERIDKEYLRDGDGKEKEAGDKDYDSTEQQEIER